ncbi:hypothetical protein RBB77_00250 [Tunturibacter psychrotolerans]|uniref:Carbohydrate-binding family V/XII n=1 Tax=Tunturiibacter psychrotolerans TaxID=3069686 RepID=A0AAU7ZQX6_9BACT
MRESRCCLVFAIASCLLIGAISSTAQGIAPASSKPAKTSTNIPPWPRVFGRGDVHLVVYQPQLKAWQKYRTMVADTAVSVTDKGQKPILGVISWRADTITNVSAQTVYVCNIQVLDARFPSLNAAQEAEMQKRAHQLYPTMTLTIGLPRMIASLEKVNDPVRSISESPEVPSILVTMSPAIVLVVDGKPVLAPIEGTSLEYVVNTNWDLFFDKSDYYLLSGKTWLKAKDLRGPWAVTAKLPPDMAKLPIHQNWDDALKAVPPSSTSGIVPKVLFAEKPSELIVFRGKPVYLKIPSTNLNYATNTDSKVFVHQPDGQVYILISGRWFRAPSLEGKWTYAGDSLPADFRMIPRSSPCYSVLVSVPGTQAASDAVLLSQVPTTAVVNRAAAEAKVKVAYAGPPKFDPIPTTTMSYAVNTSDKVIRVGDLYYLCFQGVWFVSRSPSGPWKTADSVPQVIYTTPPTSPMYNVTYVIVSNPTPTTVQTSYSSGYLGVFVVGMTVGSAIVYGTGYYYPPYVYWGPHPVYYPYPYSYGVAAVYNPYTGAYGVGHAVYGPYGSAGTAAWYNPSTGAYGRAVTTQNAYGGHTYAQGYNPWTGTYAATSQGHNQYSQWGSSVVTNGDNWAQAQHVTNSNGTAGSFQTSKGSAGAGFSGANGNSGFVAKDANNNNVYAGADGNVYKKDSSGNWSKYDNGGWTPVDPSTGANQTRQQKQSSNNPNQLSQSRSTNSSAPAAQRGTTPSTTGSGLDSTNPRAAGRGSQSQPASLPTQATPRSSASSDTMGQLQSDSRSRARGDQLEQFQSRGGGATRGVRRGR